jgi:hypothetical protein
MSAKNELQEYCQQRKISMPTYRSTSFGEAHKPNWLSEVNILDLNMQILTITPMNSKIAAEQLSAQLALNELKKEIIPSCVIDSIVLIDLENKPAFRQMLKKNAIYIGFSSTTHNSLHKYENWHRCVNDNIENELLKSNLLLYLIEGGVPDLVDHFMTAFVYPLAKYLEMNKEIKIVYVVTGDHAGFCTKACLEKVIAWKGIEGVRVKHVGSVHDVY